MKPNCMQQLRDIYFDDKEEGKVCSYVTMKLVTDHQQMMIISEIIFQIYCL